MEKYVAVFRQNSAKRLSLRWLYCHLTIETLYLYSAPSFPITCAVLMAKWNTATHLIHWFVNRRSASTINLLSSHYLRKHSSCYRLRTICYIVCMMWKTFKFHQNLVKINIFTLLIPVLNLDFAIHKCSITHHVLSFNF